MTKMICVNQDKLGKIVGYGFWTFITILLLIFLVASTLEVQSIYKYESDRPYSSCDYKYDKIFDDGYGTCFDSFDYRDKDAMVYIRNYSAIIFSIIDFIVIGL